MRMFVKHRRSVLLFLATVLVVPGVSVFSPTEASAATCKRPTAKVFLSKMNSLEDLPINEFMAVKSNKAKRTCWIDWSDDGCTKSPDSGKNFNFRKSCLRHDFAYRNSKRLEAWYRVDGWSYHNKAVADTGFKRDMTNHCFARNSWETEACLDKAWIYYKAVATVGGFASTVSDYRYTFEY